MVLFLLLCSSPWASAQNASSKEYEVKAVFLYSFAQFVNWPREIYSGPQDPLVIGVLGDDPFGPYLDDAVRDEKMNDHPLIVRRYRRVAEIGPCHILFISQSEAGRLGSILTGLKGRNILTVSDGETFAERGGVIGFVTEKNKIRLRINLEAARAANLTLSSKLLEVAGVTAPLKN